MLPEFHNEFLEPSSIQVILGVGRDMSKPLTFVAANPLESTRRFVATLSTSYHRYKLQTFTADLEGPEDHHAYQALRHTLGELLEVTAALAAASIQATEVPHIWLILYKTRHLDSCIGALRQNQPLPLPGVGGDLQQQTYADLLDIMTKTHPELRDALSAGGQGIFEAYLDDVMKAEYNALKHSNRVNPASIQGQTTVANIDWQRTMVSEQLHEIKTQGLTGHVLQWSVHPVNLTTLYAQIDLCLRWLDVLHWALRRLHGVDTTTPHPGFPALEDVTRVWGSGEAVMVVTQQLTSKGKLLEDGHRRTAVPLSEDDLLPHGITRRET